MNDWAPIKYMGFWDVPLVFVVPYKGEWFLFDCEFDEEVEDYRDFYKVYTIPSSLVDDLPKDWTRLHLQATRHVGEVAVEKVQFDPSNRREVNTSVLEELIAKEERGSTVPARRD